MPAGRRPTPSHLKVMKGNPGKRALPSNEPQPARGVPAAPRWLSKAARKHWKEIAAKLDEMGVLSHADGPRSPSWWTRSPSGSKPGR